MDWTDKFMTLHPEFNFGNVERIIKNEMGPTFAQVLECASVFECQVEGRTHLKGRLVVFQNG